MFGGIKVHQGRTQRTGDLSGPAERDKGQRPLGLRSPCWWGPRQPSQSRKPVSALFSLNLQTQRGTARANSGLRKAGTPGCSPSQRRIPAPGTQLPLDHAGQGRGRRTHRCFGGPCCMPAEPPPAAGGPQSLLKSTRVPLPPALVLVSTVTFLEEGPREEAHCQGRRRRAVSGLGGPLTSR